MSRLWTFIKINNLTIREFVFSLVAAFDEFFFWLAKKGPTKKYIYKLKKIISLVYNINYHLIVLVDRAPQRLYLQYYTYRWLNNLTALKKKSEHQRPIISVITEAILVTLQTTGRVQCTLDKCRDQNFLSDIYTVTTCYSS